MFIRRSSAVRERTDQASRRVAATRDSAVTHLRNRRRARRRRRKHGIPSDPVLDGWDVDFYHGSVADNEEVFDFYVRAVRTSF